MKWIDSFNGTKFSWFPYFIVWKCNVPRLTLSIFLYMLTTVFRIRVWKILIWGYSIACWLQSRFTLLHCDSEQTFCIWTERFVLLLDQAYFVYPNFAWGMGRKINICAFTYLRERSVQILFISKRSENIAKPYAHSQPFVWRRAYVNMKTRTYAHATSQ